MTDKNIPDIATIIGNTKLEARPYQTRIITKALTAYLTKKLRSVMIESPTGCLTGDTVVGFNIAGKSFTRTLREAYIHYHGGDQDATIGKCLCGCGELTRVPHKTDATKNQIAGRPLSFVHGHQARASRWTGNIMVRAYRGEYGIGLQPVLNIIKSGRKHVWDLVLADGKTLCGTADHPIMTKDGWVPLSALTPGIMVLTDRRSVGPTAAHKAKPRDSFIVNLWNHPYARRVRTVKESRGYTMRIARHIAIWEMNVNGLTEHEYKYIMRHGDPSNLILVDPAVFVVHHKDMDHNNNHPGNLERMTALEHNAMHGKKDFYRNFGNNTPVLVEVRSIQEAGEAMTYDICCEQPYHTFVANGIVVHNSGKTPVGLLIARGLQEVIPDLEIGWFCMRRNLLVQAEKENIEKAIGARIRFISMFDKNLPPELLLETADGKPNPLCKPNRMILIDEAQHDAVTTMASIHSRIKPQFILGMTATPFRTDCVKLCFDTIIKDAGLANLIKEGYLSQYRHFTIPRWSVKDVCFHYLNNQARWGKSIMYFHRLEECAKAAVILEKAGVALEVVTGSSDRYAQIDRFMLPDGDSNQVKLIINCMVLTEGFDCPALQTVFCRPSCKGVSIQMSGRCFRKHPDVPLKNIVQAKKGWPFIKLALPAEQYTWQADKKDKTMRTGEWMSLVINPHINELNCKMLVALAGINSPIPQYITKAAFSARGRSRRRRI